MVLPRNVMKNEKGYTLAVVVVFTTVLLVGLSEAMINWQKAMQREREEELIFRGKQFIRAVELWQRKFPRTWPTTIDALLNTNNTRFLRKRWKDPITNSQEWRLIKMNPDGSISGLTIIPSQTSTDATKNSPLDQQRASSSSSPASTPSAASSTTSSGFPTTSQTTQQSALQRGSSSSTSTASSGTPVLGGICGVASTSKKQTIKTYNGRNKYSEWEFYYVPQQQLMPAAPGQPGGGTGPRPSPNTNRPGAISSSPFPQQPIPSQPSP